MEGCILASGAKLVDLAPDNQTQHPCTLQRERAYHVGSLQLCLKHTLKKMNKTEDLTGWRLCICLLSTDNLDVVQHIVRLAIIKISAQIMVQRHCSLQHVAAFNGIFMMCIIWWKLVSTKIKPWTLARTNLHCSSAMGCCPTFVWALHSSIIFFDLLWNLELFCQLCFEPWTFVSADFEPFWTVNFCRNFFLRLEHMYHFVVSSSM